MRYNMRIKRDKRVYRGPVMMPKSGPRDLAAYHQQVLEGERRRTVNPEVEQVNSGTHPAAAPATRPPRQRAVRSDAGKARTAPAPGTVVLKLEMAVTEAHNLLMHFTRTGQTAAAHQTVDAIAKATKEA